MGFVNCQKLDDELANKQDILKDCNGNLLSANTKVPTCEQMGTAIQAARQYHANSTTTTVTGTGSQADPIKHDVTSAPMLLNGNWEVKPTPDGKLGFYCNGVLVASLDCSGNFTAAGDVAGFCAP